MKKIVKEDHLLYLFLCIFFASVFQNFYTFYSNKKVHSDTLMLSKGTMYFHSPRFHPFCFFKPLHLTITESPGRIGAAQSWSSITFLLKPLHHKTGFLSVTFAVIYSSLLRLRKIYKERGKANDHHTERWKYQRVLRTEIQH